jgi:DNA-binding LacI/PurR family transcriptional regulator
MKEFKSVSLRDVAKRSKVSVSTVSRVVNEAGNTDPETLRRVQKAIKALNYKPNRVAQRLRLPSGQRKLIGLLVPDIQNPFYVDVVRGVEDLAHEKGYAVFMGNFGQEEDKEALYLDLMLSESVDGLIVAPSNEKQNKIVELVKNEFPLVCVDRSLSVIDSDVVLVNNVQAAYDAVEHLVQRGHKRIAYIGGLPTISTTAQRNEGYIRALTKHGIEVDKQLVRFGDSKHESGKLLAAELLDLPKPPTAFFTGNSLITLGALETIHTRGKRIPEDIAIVGFDDMPWSISLNPPLTAVSQPGYEIGKRATEMLFHRIIDPHRKPVEVSLDAELIIRKST